ncbi:hypothetical protein ABT071_36335 [Streptomyces sp. NPDC002506]|uniref:hypothetical protein n=1 Tax=Streptomyces sp. NPDC002506 TaxID=3154536 RepID=UPI003321B88E
MSAAAARARRRAARAAVLVLLPALVTPAAYAAAAPPPSDATALDLQQADRTARSPEARRALGEFLAHERQRSTVGTTSAPPRAPAADGPAVSQWQPAVPVHVLNPDFVTGVPGAPPIRTEAAASTAVVAGRAFTVKTAPRDGGWSVLAISSGDDEARHTRAAGPHRIAFLEPQTNAWYAWHDDTVDALDTAAEQMLGARSVSLADYRSAVHDRYHDKMPGSAYDAHGLGGGAPLPSAGAPGASARTTDIALPLALSGIAGCGVLAATWAACRHRPGPLRSR